MATDPRIIVFRSRLRDGVSQDYELDAAHIAELAVAMPGFVSAKDFIADDGERLALIEFDSSDHLAAWRDHGEHRGAQQRGRDRYYSQYSLQICGELRASRFDAATGAITRTDRDPAGPRAIAERWLACFERRDLDGLLALYADSATHTSPKIRVRHPDTGGLLRGKAAMRAWWQDSFDRLPTMRYEPTAITADHRRVVMEYVRHVDGEPSYPVSETLDIEAGKIVASRVFHG